MVDARLPDGSRVNAIIPPLSLVGPVLSIRRFACRLQTADMLANRSLSRSMLALLEAVVAARISIIVSGGTGAGKTTLLNALSQFIGAEERIVTIEDSAELRFSQKHVVRLETRPPNMEGQGEIPTRDLVRNSLRMRPDRIIVGEVRGAEAFDMLQAMNTGHEGSMGTIHANSTRDALARLETMVLMTGFELPMPVVRQYITSAIKLVIQVSRLKGGLGGSPRFQRWLVCTKASTACVRSLASVRRAWLREEQWVNSTAPGAVPKFAKRIRAEGIELDESIFGKDTQALA